MFPVRYELNCYIFVQKKICKSVNAEAGGTYNCYSDLKG
jgi:hypothetical protein